MHHPPLQRGLERHRVELVCGEAVVRPDAGFASHPDADVGTLRGAAERDGPDAAAR